MGFIITLLFVYFFAELMMLLSFLSSPVCIVLLAVLLDRIFSEPKYGHPLVGFGNLANALEKSLNRAGISTLAQQLLGVISWLLLVIVLTISVLFLVGVLQKQIGFTVVVDAIVVYLCIAYSSLHQHGMAVLRPLLANNLVLARAQVGNLVSRDIHTLDALGVRRATIESVLENGSDAIFAPLFWFMVGGLPAIVVYRLANTLDAMWGYKTPRFLFFGRFSARIDDILNYIPSRLVGLSYALLSSVKLGRGKLALQCWREQAHTLASPNGGVVMTAGAGALNITLGGDSYYHGEKMLKPIFGCGFPPEDNDILCALKLIDSTLLLWCGLLIVGTLALHFLVSGV
jgi:adenosylcobinamide-phosphate synthase